MMATARALASTETIKLRRTLAPWIVLACPVFVCALELASLLDRDSTPVGPPVEIWRRLLLEGWLLWLALVVPMLISFVAASLASLEHGGRLWKQLFSFPIPRWSVYATKMLFCGLFVGASFLVVVPGLVGDVLIFSGVKGLHLASTIPWIEILAIAAKGFLASWPLIVVQSWLSVRFRKVLAPIGIGFAALAVGFFYLAVYGRHGRDLFSFYPWLMPFQTVSSGPYDLHSTLLPAVVGCAGGIVLGAAACWDLARRSEGD